MNSPEISHGGAVVDLWEALPGDLGSSDPVAVGTESSVVNRALAGPGDG